MIAWHDIQTAWRLGPRVWKDLARASWELARANRQFHRLTPRQLRLLAASVPATTRQSLSERQRALVERVAYALPVMGLRTPWRSDCLVQALAGRHWLARAGIAADVRLGVRTEADFGAHAWLKVGERVVTGGDVSTYAELPPARVRRELFTS